jgi:hypothetical protein
LRNHAHAQAALISQNVQTQNFARLAFRDDFKRTAADFAIRREPLAGDARVHDRFKRLAAKRTSDVFGNFHAQGSPTDEGFATRRVRNISSEELPD